MEKLTELQKISKIQNLCSLSGTPFFIESCNDMKSEFRKYIVVATIGTSQFYYSLNSFLMINNIVRQYTYFNKVIIADILI